MDRPGAILDRKSKAFFAIFFGALIASFGLTFYTLHVKKDFHAYTEEEVIPDPLDFYINALSSVRDWVAHPHL